MDMKMLTQKTAQLGLKQGEGIMKKTVVVRASNEGNKPKVGTRRSTKTIQAPMTAVKIAMTEFESVVFQGRAFGVVGYGGRFWISTYALCREFGLDYAVYCRRLIRKNYPCKLFSTIIAGTTHELLCLEVTHLHAWLCFINPGWLKPEAKLKLVAYRQGLLAAIEAHFGQNPYFDYRKKAPFVPRWKCRGSHEDTCGGCPFLFTDEANVETWGYSQDCPFQEIEGDGGGIFRFVPNTELTITKTLFRQLLRGFPADRLGDIETMLAQCRYGYQILEEELGYIPPMRNARIKEKMQKCGGGHEE